ncbi:MAG: hypothetical protein K9H11_21790, partial [Rhodospirillum sp.]|nr:hypothetical protein [Rhodospirillum sp.]
AQVELGPAELRAEVRRTLGGDNGFTGELGTSVKHALTPSLMLEGDGRILPQGVSALAHKEQEKEEAWEGVARWEAHGAMLSVG